MVALGFAAFTSPATPETWGAANDVPVPQRYANSGVCPLTVNPVETMNGVTGGEHVPPEPPGPDSSKVFPY